MEMVVGLEYYLPFCMMFVSSDRLHRAAAPLFLRPDQKFIWGPDLKVALAEINAHYAKLPDAEKEKGIFAIAKKPPKDAGVLVASLWTDFLSPGILDEILRPVGGEKPTPDEKKLVAELNEFVRMAKKAPAQAPHEEDPDSFVIQRKVSSVRGSWRIVSKKIADSKPDDV